ncbi:hypothetical protein CEXT_752371 [Caerostris extrusa]|uniref:Uncharacterized protein n=1 Tax=Caerostris extrusa TaxID=172846 RepID=A0AAV4SAD2_CAEEX|nr:hypothetical protein CEXT_752371 [Caerostris extrusa]
MNWNSLQSASWRQMVWMDESHTINDALASRYSTYKNLNLRRVLPRLKKEKKGCRRSTRESGISTLREHRRVILPSS